LQEKDQEEDRLQVRAGVAVVHHEIYDWEIHISVAVHQKRGNQRNHEPECEHLYAVLPP
jgi:hypothetical protein